MKLYIWEVLLQGSLCAVSIPYVHKYPVYIILFNHIICYTIGSHLTTQKTKLQVCYQEVYNLFTVFTLTFICGSINQLKCMFLSPLKMQSNSLGAYKSLILAYRYFNLVLLSGFVILTNIYGTRALTKSGMASATANLC